MGRLVSGHVTNRTWRAQGSVSGGASVPVVSQSGTTIGVSALLVAQTVSSLVFATRITEDPTAVNFEFGAGLSETFFGCKPPAPLYLAPAGFRFTTMVLMINLGPVRCVITLLHIIVNESGSAIRIFSSQ